MLSYSAMSDAELALLLKKGDAFAYTEIYNRYKGLLYLFAYRRLADREEARDLIHELFLSVWTKCSDINITSTLAAYLYTSVRNRILDLVSHKQVSLRYMESFQNYIESGHNSTDHLVRHNELFTLIEREIAALPPKMRQVFELSRKTDYSRKEIADELGLSEQTVKSHMHHALKILKVKLGSLFFLILF
jgi:RNA polymerase sigma-70 factor (family 1)